MFRGSAYGIAMHLIHCVQGLTLLDQIRTPAFIEEFALYFLGQITTKNYTTTLYRFVIRKR
jgi:hypothetical protein